VLDRKVRGGQQLTHTITMNKVPYLQDTDGVIVEASEYMADLGTIHNLHAVNRMPDELNTDDPARTCPRCHTAYRLSEIKEGCRCPFCYVLIEGL
jgi:hypothetical protein